MNKKILIGVVVLAIWILISSLLSDKPAANTYEEPTTDVMITYADKGVTEIPFYPNAEVVSSKETSRDDTRIFYAFTFETTDTIAEVNDWYEEALSTNTWSIKSDKTIGGYRLIQGERDGYYASMQASKGEGDIVVISLQAHVKNDDY